MNMGEMGVEYVFLSFATRFSRDTNKRMPTSSEKDSDALRPEPARRADALPRSRRL